MLDLRKQTFGIEIEMTGITREKAASVIAMYFGGHTMHHGGGYDTYLVHDAQGRVWKTMNDSSINSQKKVDGRKERAEYYYQTEVVTPVLKYDDLDDLQQIVRELRKAGAFVNKSCGIHIHIGAEKHTPNSLSNLVKIMASKEELIYKALDVLPNRANRYTKKIEKKFLEAVIKDKPQSMAKFYDDWYENNGGDDCRTCHYNNSRYHGLNLHATNTKGTVEFRLFNSTLHAGKIKAYIQFCLALNAMAINQKSATFREAAMDNPKYTFRCFLLRLGLIGDEFKTCRLHMLTNLDGNSAWRQADHAA